MTYLKNDADRAFLDQILDLLIPANPSRRIPAAGTLGVAEFVNRSAGQNPVQADCLSRFLEGAKGIGGVPSVDMLQMLEQSDPVAFQTVLRLVYMGYCSRSDIRQCLGIAPWPVHPAGYDVPSEPPSLLDGLTTPVRARGPIFRDPEALEGNLR